MYKKFMKYCFSPIMTKETSSNKALKYHIPYAAVLAVITAIMQASGNYIPVLGYVISAFSTLPVMIAAIFSINIGIATFFGTTFLLLIIQPSEFFIFPLTTGLLGLGFGIGLVLLNKRLFVILISSLLLMAGICFSLYVIEFPLLGPISTEISLNIFTNIWLFTLFYSWIFFELCLYLQNKIKESINLNGF